MGDKGLIDRDYLKSLLETPILSLDELRKMYGIIDEQPRVVTTSDRYEGYSETIPCNCKNCGGRVDRYSRTCLYCGTEY